MLDHLSLANQCKIGTVIIYSSRLFFFFSIYILTGPSIVIEGDRANTLLYSHLYSVTIDLHKICLPTVTSKY